ncbi:ORF6N domain-containing protein, partial [Mailhella massiliensis]
LAYKGIPVVTTETLALAYEVDAVSIRKNFSCNKGRFTEGKHYFSITGKELSAFRLSVTESNSQISPKVRALTLWTERGAARHAKMLNSDKAWDMFELLEETFFRVAVKKVQEDLELTPADRSDLKALVDAKLSTCPAKLQGKARAELWARFNRHFRIAAYCRLPQEKMSEARDDLITLELNALKAVETRKAAVLPMLRLLSYQSRKRPS